MRQEMGCGHFLYISIPNLPLRDRWGVFTFSSLRYYDYYKQRKSKILKPNKFHLLNDPIMFI